MCSSRLYISTHSLIIQQGLVFIPLPMYFAWAAMSVSVGFIIKQQIICRNIKKVIHVCMFSFWLTEIWLGKYLLERERLIKENAWNLSDDVAAVH